MRHRKRNRRPSRVIREACATFGVTLREADTREGVGASRLAALAEALDRTLPPGGVALVTGPSGTGKTRLLHALRKRLRKTRRACVEMGGCHCSPRGCHCSPRGCHCSPRQRRSSVMNSDAPLRSKTRERWHPDRALRVLDVVSGCHCSARGCHCSPRGCHCSPRQRRRSPRRPMNSDAPLRSKTRERWHPDRDRSHAALALLARAGLADAWVIVSRADRLSAGEAWRLALARAMARASQRDSETARQGTVTLLIDEFASLLDRATAEVLARLAHRWARTTGIRIIAASAHDDLLESLGPDAIVVFDGDGGAQIVAKPRE